MGNLSGLFCPFLATATAKSSAQRKGDVNDFVNLDERSGHVGQQPLVQFLPLSDKNNQAQKGFKTRFPKRVILSNLSLRNVDPLVLRLQFWDKDIIL